MFRVTDITCRRSISPPTTIKKLKDSSQRGLTDEQVAQYVTKLETDIGTTINRGRLRAGDRREQQLSSKARDGRPQIDHRKSRDRRDAVARRSGVRLRQHDVRRSHALADGRPADGAARARRDRRRDHRRGLGDARQDAAGQGARRTPSTWSAPAATAPARSTSRPAPSFIVAGAGVPVAKHGNRALSSRSGAADVLASLGVKIDLTPDQVGRCVSEAGIGFMFAPAHHPAMKNVGPTRVELAHPHDLQSARARCPIRPASSGRWSACSRGNGCSRWRRC